VAPVPGWGPALEVEVGLRAFSRSLPRGQDPVRMIVRIGETYRRKEFLCAGRKKRPV